MRMSLLLVFTILTLGYAFSANVKQLNTDLTISNIDFTQANDYWQICLDESNNDDNLRKAYYVGNAVSPKFGYSYSATNSNRARSVLDSSTVLVYNPSTFVNNGVFGLLSNIAPNGSNVKITRPDVDIDIVDNTVGRSNMAGLFVLAGQYQTVLLGNSNTSNFLGYRLDYFQNTPLYVQRDYTFVNSPVSRYSCAGYYVAKCGDGIIDNVNKTGNIDTDGKYGILVGNDIVQRAAGSPDETCDDGNMNGQYGYCNETCNGIVGDIPTCEVDVIDTNNGAYNVNWIITGAFDIPALMTISPNVVNFPTHNITANAGTIVNIVPLGYGLYTVTLTVSNSAGSSTCTDTFYVQEEEYYCGDGNIDSPNSLGVYEQCDDGNTNNGDGCENNCELSVPSCNLSVSPNSQIVGSPVNFYANTNVWAEYLTFDLDDGTVLSTGNINFVYSHVYNTFGFYNPVLTVRNNYSPIAANVTRPINTCNTVLDITSVNSELDIDKILVTTGSLFPGDEVEYLIELTNNGDVVYNDAYIIDELPSSLELIYHDISGVYPYTGASWQDVYGNWIVEYSGFNLNPGQTAVLVIRGEIREGASEHETLNCAFTFNDFDCELYSLSADPYILKSQSMSNSYFSVPFTTGNISVSTNDYITYRIDFENIGGGNTNSGVLLRDHMPLCVDYISASINGVSSANFVQYQDINGRWVLEYSDFDLNQGQAGYMIVTGQIISGGVCDTVSSYTNDSYIYFYDPMVVESSSVTAIKTEQSIVNLIKDSDPDIHMPGDDKLFVVQVENFGPNPISDIVLEDIWPATTCIAYDSWTGVGFTKDPLSLERYYSNTLLPGGTITLYISGSILDNNICENPDYENIVNLNYTELGVEYEQQANYHFAVSATPVANISIFKTADRSVVSSGDEITYTITYQNIGNATLDNYVITDYWPSMVDFVTASPFPSSVLNLTTGTLLRWNFYSPLLPGQTGEIILEGVVN